MFCRKLGVDKLATTQKRVGVSAPQREGQIGCFLDNQILVVNTEMSAQNLLVSINLIY